MDSATLQMIQTRAARTVHLLREMGPTAAGAHLLKRATHSQVEVGSLTFFIHRTDRDGPSRSLSSGCGTGRWRCLRARRSHLARGDKM